MGLANLRPRNEEPPFLQRKIQPAIQLANMWDLEK